MLISATLTRVDVSVFSVIELVLLTKLMAEGAWLVLSTVSENVSMALLPEVSVAVTRMFTVPALRLVGVPEKA